MISLEQLDGMFVGQLDADELELFNNAVKVGLARRVYVGGAGFMGLAKVAVNPRSGSAPAPVDASASQSNPR